FFLFGFLNQMKALFALIFSLSWTILLNAQNSMPLDSLGFQFEKVKEICKRDDGKLWGKSLYGPILVINKTLKWVVANQPDSLGQLKKIGNVYVGKYPENSIVACGVTSFAGRSWMVMTYPFDAEDSFELYRIYIHESFHRIQEDLGLNCNGYNNRHMDKMEARIYLDLEWQALLKAIISSDEDRNIAIKDALLFRQARRQLFPGADTMESRFEIHEGLADYTAFKLCCNSETELKEKLLKRKSWYINNEGSCVRTFGYFSGFLYAYLLDETGTSWQKKLKCGDDLGTLLQHLLKIDLSIDTSNWFNQSKSRYPYEDICNQELKIHNKKEKILSDYKIKFTQKSVLQIDLISASYGIYSSPYPIDSLGAVYPVIDISDKWGILKVKEGGCLISKSAVVTAEGLIIDNQSIQGQGWTLKLNNDWSILKQGNNYIIKENINAP
ncbi:MAG: hypothetical protein Q8905_10920, partial [Bacteroidota bacterium]|nr:hypothetical protein [Bacteroidota bacterium]